MEKKKKQQLTEALEKARTICARQEQCRDDIGKKLETLGLEKEERSFILEKLVSENFINEKRYASAYVKDKFRFNKWGRLKIRHGLARKNLSSELIDRALEESIPEHEYLRLLEEELKKKTKNLKGNLFARKAKLMRFAQSRGFEAALTYKVIEQIYRGETSAEY